VQCRSDYVFFASFFLVVFLFSLFMLCCCFWRIKMNIKENAAQMHESELAQKAEFRPVEVERRE